MKKILSLFVLFLLVNSMFVVAEDDVSTSDCGFFCSVGEFLWGSSENRVGKGWFDRGNLVGMADEDGEEQEGFYEISTNDGKVYLQLQEGETIQGRPDWTHTGYHTLSTNKREYIFYDIGTYRFTDKDTQTTRFYSKEGRLVSASITDDDYKYTYLHLGGESPRYTKSPLSGGPSESIGYADREIKNQLVPDQSEIKILTEQEYVTIQTSSVDSREQDDGGAAAVANTERLERQQAELFINNAGAGNLVAVKKYVNDGGDINAKRNGINTALYAAAYNGKLDVVKYLLDQPGIDINLGEPNRKITPLHIAVIRGHTEVVESLLRAGADTNARDYAGRTPLELAGDNSIIKDIFEQQFSRNEQVVTGEFQTNDGNSGMSGEEESVLELIAKMPLDSLTLPELEKQQRLLESAEDGSKNSIWIQKIINKLTETKRLQQAQQPVAEQQPETQSLTESQPVQEESSTSTESAKRQYVKTFIQGQNLDQGPSRCGAWVREASKEMGLSEVPPPTRDFLFHAWEAEKELTEKYEGTGGSLDEPDDLNKLQEGDFITAIYRKSSQRFVKDANGENTEQLIKDSNGDPRKATHIGRVIKVDGELFIMHQLGRNGKGSIWNLDQWRDAVNRGVFLNSRYIRANLPSPEKPIDYAQKLDSYINNLASSSRESTETSVVVDQETASENYEEFTHAVETNDEGINSLEFTLLREGELSVSCSGSGCSGTYLRQKLSQEANKLGITIIINRKFCDGTPGGFGSCSAIIGDSETVGDKSSIEMVKESIKNGQIGLAAARVDQETSDTDTIDEEEMEEDEGGEMPGPDDEPDIPVDEEGDPDETGDEDLDELDDENILELPKLQEQTQSIRDQLVLAVSDGKTEDVKKLIEDNEIDINSEFYGSTLLHRAAFEGNEVLVKYLLYNGADPQAMDSNGKTPIEIAEEGENIIIIEFFRESIGSSEPVVSQEQPAEETAPLTPEELNEKLREELDKGESDVGVIVDLIEQGADVDTLNSYYDKTALTLAASAGLEDVVRSLLAKNPIDKNSALLSAIKNDHTTIARLILDAGVDLEGEIGVDVLNTAAERGNKEAVELLLDRGATDRKGALSSAVAAGKTEIVKILLEMGVNVDDSMLREAENGGHVNVVIALREAQQKQQAAEKNLLALLAQLPFMDSTPEEKEEVAQDAEDSGNEWLASLIRTPRGEELPPLDNLPELDGLSSFEVEDPGEGINSQKVQLDPNLRDLKLECSGTSCNKEHLSNYFREQKNQAGITTTYPANCNDAGTECTVTLNENDYNIFNTHFSSSQVRPIAISGNVELQPGYKFELEGDSYELEKVTDDNFYIVNIKGINEPLTEEEWLMDVNDHRRSQVQSFTYNEVEYKRVTDFRNTELDCNAYDCAHVFRGDGGETLIYNSDNELFGFYSVATGLLSNEGLEDYGYKYARLIFEERILMVADEEEREYRANNYMQTEIVEPEGLELEKVEELSSAIGAHSTESTSETRTKLITLLVESGQDREGLNDLSDAQLNQRASEISNEYRVRNLLAKIASATSSSEITEHQYDRDPRVEKAFEDKIGVLLPPEDAIALRKDIDDYLGEGGASEGGVEKVQEIIGNDQNDEEVINYAREQLDEYYQRTIVQQLGSGNLDLANEIINNPDNYGGDMVAIAQIELQEYYFKVVDQQIALGNFGTVSEMIKNEDGTYNDYVVAHAKEQITEQLGEYVESLIESGRAGLGVTLLGSIEGIVNINKRINEVYSDASNPKSFYYEDQDGNLVEYVETNYDCPSDYDCSGGTYKSETEDIITSNGITTRTTRTIVFNKEGEMVGIELRNGEGLLNPNDIGSGSLGESVSQSYKSARGSSVTINNILDEDTSLEEIENYLNHKNLQISQIARKTYYQRLNDEGIVVNKIDTDLLGKLTGSIDTYNAGKIYRLGMDIAAATEKNSQNLEKVIGHISEITGISVEKLKSLTPEQLEIISAQVQNKATDANNKLITIRTGEDFNQIADLESDPNPLVSTSAGDMMDSYLFRDEKSAEYFYDENGIRYESVLNVEYVEGCTVLKCGYAFRGENGKIIIYDNDNNPIGTATTDNPTFTSIDNEDDRVNYARLFDEMTPERTETFHSLEASDSDQVRARYNLEIIKIPLDFELIEHLKYILRERVKSTEVNIDQSPNDPDIAKKMTELNQLIEDFNTDPSDISIRDQIDTFIGQLTSYNPTDVGFLKLEELRAKYQEYLTQLTVVKRDIAKIQSSTTSEDVPEEMFENRHDAVKDTAEETYFKLGDLEVKKIQIDGYIEEKTDEGYNKVMEIIQNEDSLYNEETVAYAESQIDSNLFGKDSTYSINSFIVGSGHDVSTYKAVDVTSIERCPTLECAYAMKLRGQDEILIFNSNGENIGTADTNDDNKFQRYSASATSIQQQRVKDITEAFKAQLEKNQYIRTIKNHFFGADNPDQIRAEAVTLKTKYDESYHELIDTVVKETVDEIGNERVPLVKSFNVDSVSGTKTYTPFKNTNLIKGCDSNKCAYGFVNDEGFIILYNNERQFTGYVNTGESTSEYTFNAVTTSGGLASQYAKYTNALIFAADNVIPSEEGVDVDLAAEEIGLVPFNEFESHSGSVYVDKGGNLYTLEIEFPSLSSAKVTPTVLFKSDAVPAYLKESGVYGSSIKLAQELFEANEGRLERELSALKIHTIGIEGTDLFVGSDRRIYNKEKGRLATAEEKATLDNSDEIKNAVTLATKRATTMKSATESGVFENAISIKEDQYYVLKPVPGEEGTTFDVYEYGQKLEGGDLITFVNSNYDQYQGAFDEHVRVNHFPEKIEVGEIFSPENYKITDYEDIPDGVKAVYRSETDTNILIMVNAQGNIVKRSVDNGANLLDVSLSIPNEIENQFVGEFTKSRNDEVLRQRSTRELAYVERDIIMSDLLNDFSIISDILDPNVDAKRVLTVGYDEAPIKLEDGTEIDIDIEVDKAKLVELINSFYTSRGLEVPEGLEDKDARVLANMAKDLQRPTEEETLKALETAKINLKENLYNPVKVDTELSKTAARWGIAINERDSKAQLDPDIAKRIGEIADILNTDTPFKLAEAKATITKILGDSDTTKRKVGELDEARLILLAEEINAGEMTAAELVKLRQSVTGGGFEYVNQQDHLRELRRQASGWKISITDNLIMRDYTTEVNLRSELAGNFRTAAKRTIPDDDEQKRALVEMGILEKLDSKTFNPGDHIMGDGFTTHINEKGTIDSVEPPRDRNAYGEIPTDVKWVPNGDTKNGYWEFQGVKLYYGETGDYKISDINRKTDDNDFSFTEGLDEAEMKCYKDNAGGSCYLYDDNKLNAWDIEGGEVKGVNWAKTGTWVDRYIRDDLDDDAEAYLGGYVLDEDGEPLLEDGKRVSNKWHQAIFGISGILTSTSQWRGLTHLLMGKESWYKDWSSKIENGFAKAMGTENLARAACQYEQRSRDKQDGQNSVFIATSPGVYQFVGSIQAEMTKESTYLTCAQDENYDYTVCPGDLNCKDGICYENNNLVKAYQYKISWGVLAPQDVKKTPYIDENGKAVKFNIYLTNTDCNSNSAKYLYERPRTEDKREVIELENGASDRDIIIDNSKTKYKNACICFDNRHLSRDRTSNPVRQICAKIAESEQKEVKYDVASSKATQTTSATVERNSIW